MLHKLLAQQPVSVDILGGPFRGAKVLLNPATSKRKIFGLYENVLNDWIRSAIVGKEFVLDVGANTGYDTYGFAHLLQENGVASPTVLAIEPNVLPELDIPRQWDCYSACRIEILQNRTGHRTEGNTICLDDAVARYLPDSSGPGLIKIDIEGDEIETLRGAAQLLNDSRHDWLIEIHGKESIPEIAKSFVLRDRPFLIKDLAPLPAIGAEARPLYTSWLLTV